MSSIKYPVDSSAEKDSIKEVSIKKDASSKMNTMKVRIQK